MISRSGVAPLRTPENQRKCTVPGPGKFLSFGSNVCANPGKFGAIFGHMYVQNPGKLLGGEGGMYQNPGEFLAAACARRHLGMPTICTFQCEDYACAR